MRRLWSPWAVLLVGPVVGMTYFWLVYLLGEVACSEHLDLLGEPALRVAVLATAAGAGAVLVAYAWRARRLLAAPAGDGDAESDGENRRFMATTGAMVIGLFALFVLFLAAPVIGASLC